MNNKIKTASQLKAAYEEANPGGCYFTRGNMRFFGDTMSNYGVTGPIKMTVRGEERLVYELYRRKPVKEGFQFSAYFDAETFKKVPCTKGGKQDGDSICCSDPN